VEKNLQEFLFALGDVQKGLDLYSRGRREDGNHLIDAALRSLDGALSGPGWLDFFTRVSDYLAGLEMVDLGTMERAALDEAGLLKKYGLTMRDLLQLQRLHKSFKERDEAADLPALFATPDNLAARLAEQVAAMKQEIDRARSLPRKLKKFAKKIARSRVTHLLAGSALITANFFWQKEQQTSVSIGLIFLNSAIKK
jgi:hypothetical protein